MKNLISNLKESHIRKHINCIAWHWYDFTCPFCYVSKNRNKILEGNGFKLIDLPFQAHPEVPAEGVFMGERKGAMYDLLEEEARDANLPLNWPLRLPNSRYALAVAEQVRRRLPDQFQKVKDRLFAAHFSLGEDLGSREVVHRCLNEVGIPNLEISNWMTDAVPYDEVRASELAAINAGIRGTPAWVVNGQLISGLQSRAFFDSCRPDLN